jgi:nicotinate-nucleotide pyrophosphorylase
MYDMMMITDNHIAAAGGIRCGRKHHLMSSHEVFLIATHAPSLDFCAC